MAWLKDSRNLMPLKFDIIQWFDDLKNSFGRGLESPEDLPEVLKNLREFLPRDSDTE